MSFRLAAYAVCIDDGRALLVRHRSGTWTLPGGRVEFAEDPLDAVEDNGETLEATWTPLADIAALPRSALVDVGLALAATRPANGHVAAVPVGGLVGH